MSPNIRPVPWLESRFLQWRCQANSYKRRRRKPKAGDAIGVDRAWAQAQAASARNTSERNSRRYSTSTTPAVTTAIAHGEKNHAIAAKDM